MFEDAPKAEVTKEDQDFLVLEENWPAINLFLACQTQWQYLSGMSSAVRTGFNYPAVETVIRLCYANHNQAELFSKLQLMESEALAIFSADI